MCVRSTPTTVTTLTITRSTAVAALFNVRVTKLRPLETTDVVVVVVVVVGEGSGIIQCSDYFSSTTTHYALRHHEVAA